MKEYVEKKCSKRTGVTEAKSGVGMVLVAVIVTTGFADPCWKSDWCCYIYNEKMNSNHGIFQYHRYELFNGP